jgi:hypothetical protein
MNDILMIRHTLRVNHLAKDKNRCKTSRSSLQAVRLAILFGGWRKVSPPSWIPGYVRPDLARTEEVEKTAR